MDWTRIIDAAGGRAEALSWFVRQRPDVDDAAALQMLLLLEETLHPAAALVAAAATVWLQFAPPTHAALAPHVAPALATWRADPQWANRAIGDEVTKRRFAQGVAGMVGALHDLPAAHHDAVAIVVRDGDSDAVARCLDALGADGWTALDAPLRRALAVKAPADALGRVWAALDVAQRAAAAQAAASRPSIAARLIGRIGAAAWDATDRALRERLIDAVARSPWWVSDTAPAWAGMTDDERETLARAVIAQGAAAEAINLLDALGAAGRATLTVEQRAAIESLARNVDSWRVPAWRAADAGWGALTDDERRAVLATAEAAPWRVAVLLRDVGAAGWTAMRADERKRLAAAVRGSPDTLFSCPPTLWTALVGDSPPPTRGIPDNAIAHWRAEDADADLGGLPPSHQAVVLALAPWRPEDAAKDSVRVRRLCVAWDAMTTDDRVALATAQPRVLASVAAAARLADGASAAVDAVGETVARRAAATDRAAATRIVAAMLRTPDRWRAWMVGVAPTDGDPSGAWKAWRAAARRGIVDDVTLCARLAAKEREEAKPARALRRTGR